MNMNTNNPDTAHVPNTSLLSDSEKIEPAAVDTLNQAVVGAHNALDRLANNTAPTVRRIAETSDEWTANLRHSVRDQPLMAVLAAFALGALVGRITR